MEIVKSTAYLAILFLTIVAFVIASPQKITFYEKEFCGADGKNETLTTTRDDLSTVWIKNATSMRIFGLWKISIKTEQNEGGFQDGWTIVHYRTQAPHGRCVDKSEWTDIDYKKFHFTFAEILGPSEDMEDSSLTFYTEGYYSGLRYNVRGDMDAVGPRPFVMQSYIHFSNDSWTVYPEKNFTGPPIYLQPDGSFVTPAEKDFYSYNSATEIIVGSIKKGLHQSDDDEKDKSSASPIATSLLLSLALLIFSLTR